MNKEGLLSLVEIAGKTMLSTIPVGGTLATLVWETVKSNKLDKRAKEWKLTVENRLSNLEISLDEIRESENFTTCILRTTELAARTSSTKKKEYLANALINSISLDIDEVKLLIFLNLIEKYTELHIIILDFFSNPLKFDKVKNSNFYMGSPMSLFYEVHPTLKEQNEIIILIIKELYADGLVSSEFFNVTMTKEGVQSGRVTQLGNKFLEFFS